MAPSDENIPDDTEILEVAAGDYAVVLHGHNEKGAVNDAHLLAARALVLSSYGVCVGAMTTLGVQMHVPICGPEGEVTLCDLSGAKTFWPDLETYTTWAKKNAH